MKMSQIICISRLRWDSGACGLSSTVGDFLPFPCPPHPRGLSRYRKITVTCNTCPLPSLFTINKTFPETFAYDYHYFFICFFCQKTQFAGHVLHERKRPGSPAFNACNCLNRKLKLRCQAHATSLKVVGF